ncbi:UNVERIFIED_CONTAM: hypothetical protein FKN15_037749 [Acipenser sinensis]
MSCAKTKNVQKSLKEKAGVCRENGYLLSSVKIGTGAFSKVYLGYATPDKICQNYKLATDLRTKNHNMVAIKIIPVSEAPPAFSRKFLNREICALNATYKHPCVIQLYETFRSSGHFYLVLELASHGDLLEYVNAVSSCRGNPGLDEDDARIIFKQIISAVAHCHNNHIVHRDLKCENILLDGQGFVKLTDITESAVFASADFGFANKNTDKSALMSTFCGSVAYTAPEILLARKYNGEQAELWSLGVILFAMVTGKLPFHESHPHKLLQRIRHDGIHFHHPVSPGCEDLIRKLLQWRPSARLNLGQMAAHPWISSAVPFVYNVLHEYTSQGKTYCQGKKAKESRGDTGTRPVSTLPHRRKACDIPNCFPEFVSVTGKNVRQHERDVERNAEVNSQRLGVKPQSRLHLRSAHQSDNPNRLFMSRPRPPSDPQPFHKPTKHTDSSGNLRQSRKIISRFHTQSDQPK